ncbi:hypothetical protein BYT27DRAFT_7172243 [Phlegmacium glaucopus]|nr:hypothetical protein BYT27DRAFT_7172243 [Phlegmacium glaucopus]
MSSDSDVKCTGTPPSFEVVINLMIGIIISSLAYVIVLTLPLVYLPLHLKMSDISRRMRNFLLVYVTFMVTVSTVYLITMTIALSNRFGGSLAFLECVGLTLLDWTRVHNFAIGLVAGLCVLFASWGAQGLMLWRCAMLYEGVSRPRRIALIIVLVCMGLLSIGCCLASGLTHTPSFKLSFLIFTATTLFLNLVTAILITLRILYLNRYIQKTVESGHNSPYMTIIIICVESSALIAIFSSIYLILFFQQPEASLILISFLVHVYVISALLSVNRVARGNSAIIRQRPSDNEIIVPMLQFEPPPPAPTC